MMTNLGSFALITNHTNWTTNFDTTSLSNGTNIYTFLAVSSNAKSNTFVYTNIIDNSAPGLGEALRHRAGELVSLVVWLLVLMAALVLGADRVERGKLPC